MSRKQKIVLTVLIPIYIGIVTSWWSIIGLKTYYYKDLSSVWTPPTGINKIKKQDLHKYNDFYKVNMSDGVVVSAEKLKNSKSDNMNVVVKKWHFYHDVDNNFKYSILYNEQGRVAEEHVKTTSSAPGFRYKIYYKHSMLNAHEMPIVTSYFDPQGIKIKNTYGIWKKINKYNNSQLVKASYYDLNDKPMLNNENVHALEFFYDSNEKLKRRRYTMYLVNSLPLTNQSAYVDETVNDDGAVVEQVYLNIVEEPVIGDNGYSSRHSEFLPDTTNKKTREYYLDPHGKRVFTKSEHTCEYKAVYSGENNKLISEKYSYGAPCDIASNSMLGVREYFYFDDGKLYFTKEKNHEGKLTRLPITRYFYDETGSHKYTATYGLVGGIYVLIK